ncbi:MAG: hypothetical protein NZ957_01840 [Thaumarchaeota archaeon]|nr:hypothetical protein [Candidatus Calditenuaceae archaeon]
MTEIIVLSKPRTRFVRWRGGGGGYHAYFSPVTFPTFPLVSDGVTDLILSSSTLNEVALTYIYPGFGQQFWTPHQNVALRKVAILFRRVGNPTGTITVELRSDATRPDGGTLLASLGSVNMSSIPTSSTLIEFSPASPVVLAVNTRYWIHGVLSYSFGDSSNYIATAEVVDDVHPNASRAIYDAASGSWAFSPRDYRMNIQFANLPNTYTFSLDFQYGGAGIKRLEDVGSYSNITITRVTVNNVNVGTALTRYVEIPQSSSYTVTYTFAITGTPYTFQPVIQRYLLFNERVLTLEDLGGSEAYITKVTMSANGGHLRIDDDPASELFGSASTSFVFEAGTVPFRKLEWLAGGGEVDILVVE